MLCPLRATAALSWTEEEAGQSRLLQFPASTLLFFRTSESEGSWEEEAGCGEVSAPHTSFSASARP